MRAEFQNVRQQMQAGFSGLRVELQAVEKRTAQEISKLLMWATGVWVATTALIIAVFSQLHR